MGSMDSGKELRAKSKQVEKSMKLEGDVPKQANKGLSGQDPCGRIKMKVWQTGCKKQAVSVSGECLGISENKHRARCFSSVTYRVHMTGSWSLQRFQKLCSLFYATSIVNVEVSISLMESVTLHEVRFTGLTSPDEPKATDVTFDAEFWVFKDED